MTSWIESARSLGVCSSEPKPRPFLPLRDSMSFSRPANAPPTMNSTFVVSIWMNSWCGCLRPPCGRDRGGGALEDLQQRLLHALAGDVAGDRRVLALAGDLVDLVDVDDARLGLLDVVVGGLDQLEEDVLDVLADVAGLGQGRGVRDGERDVEHAGQRLREVGLAAAGRADQQDVGLGDVDRLGVLLAGPPRPPGSACSGCRPRRRAPAWRRPGRSRSSRGSRRSRAAWAARRGPARRTRRAPPR